MSNTEALRAAAQQALECLEQLQGGCTDSGDGTVEAITVWCPEIVESLRAALAQSAASGDSAGHLPGHLYNGDCPAENQPNSRDPDCPACRAMDSAPKPAPEAALRTAARLVLDATPDQLPMALDALADVLGPNARGNGREASR